MIHSLMPPIQCLLQLLSGAAARAGQSKPPPQPAEIWLLEHHHCLSASWKLEPEAVIKPRH